AGNPRLAFGVANLARRITESKMPALLANVRERDGTRVPWAKPWRIVEKGAWKIALVGLVALETPEITHPDARELTFVDPARALAEVRTELAGRADWILPLTHLGVDSDRELARAHPDLPLVVGGHSHTFLKD